MTNVITVKPSDTHVSKCNVRYNKPIGDISELVATMREQGQLQNVIFRKEDGKLGVLAGRRRRAALVKLEKELPDILITGKLVEVDDAEARAISLTENVEQEAMSESDKWRIYPKLIKDGWSEKTIAKVYSTTEKKVRQICALGDLAPTVLTAFDNEDINESCLHLLACAAKAKVSEWVKQYRSGEYCPTWEDEMTEFLFKEENTYETKVALFDSSQIPVVNDLFGEKEVFADSEAFWKLQTEAVELEKQSLVDNGWNDVLDCTYFYEHQYEKRAKKDGGNVFVVFENDGQVTFHKGYVSFEQLRAEAQAEEKGVSVEDVQEEKAEKPEITAALKDYLALYIAQAARTQVVSDSNFGKRVLVAMLLTHSGDITTRSDYSFGKFDDDNDHELTKGDAFKAYTKAKNTLFESVKLSKETGWSSEGFEKTLTKCLAASNDQIDAVLSTIAADALIPHCEATTIIHRDHTKDMSAIWDAQSGGVFFDKLRNKALLFKMIEGVASAEEVVSVEKSKVGEIKQHLINLVSKVKGWTPEYFHGKGYLTGNGIPFKANAKQK